MEPFILPREDHCVSRKGIAEEALKVLYRLNTKGYTAYLVGGCVRDLLLGREPKDFDIATDATPRQVAKTFRNCRLIGRRFRLAHVYFPGVIIEVATFRASVESSSHQEQDADGMVVRDNVWGSPKEDALRRDFTVNALFYDIRDFSIIDYAEALRDLEDRKIRCIGDPVTRYVEDPVRMLRAVRFAATLDFHIEEQAWDAICSEHERLALASNARLFEETLKFFSSGASLRAFELMHESGLLRMLYSTWTQWLDNEADPIQQEELTITLQWIDQQIEAGHSLSPALAYAMIFAPYHEAKAKALVDDGIPYLQAIGTVMEAHQKALHDSVHITQRYLGQMISITGIQPSMLNNDPEKAARIKSYEWFPEAFSLFQFRTELTGNNSEMIKFWNDIEAAPRRRRPRRRGRKPRN